MLVCEPVIVMLAPPPATVTPAPFTRATVPLVAVKTTCRSAPFASISETEKALPFAVEKVLAVSSAVDWAPSGKALTGASLIGSTVTVTVAKAVLPLPSPKTYVNVSVPAKFVAG